MQNPLRQFLKDTTHHWDHGGTPQNVRKNFRKLINCGTLVLGAEVFASSTEVQVVCHTCKSRFCPSCGARAAVLWQEQLEACLPNLPFQEINFTMPAVFWPVFQENRHLLNDLPSVGARAIEFWVNARHGARVILMVVQQTYGGFLNFYPHLHTLVSAGGLNLSRLQWIQNLEFERIEHRRELMLAWRLALIGYLETAIEAKVLKSDLDLDELTAILEIERKRDWNTFVGRKVSKRIVIDHIGRYIRKPPIAQYRFQRINDNEVQYVVKDTRNKCLRAVRYTNLEFLQLLAPHVIDRYCNSMRYFGLLAPRAKNLLSTVFSLLKQEQRPKPVGLSYATSLYRTFGRNPLIGRDGSTLHRAGRIAPSYSN